jgi:SnoaL-like domain
MLASELSSDSTSDPIADTLPFKLSRTMAHRLIALTDANMTRRLLMVASLLCAPLRLAAQQAPAPSAEFLDRSLAQLVTDYTRLYTRDSLPAWRALFSPTFTAANTTADGGTNARGFADFFASQERAFASGTNVGERLEHVRIERRGRIASVWAEFVYWNDDAGRRGRLVLTAINGKDGWRYQSLMFSYHD